MLRSVGFSKLSKVTNCHFQIHFNFKSFSPFDFAMLSKEQGILRYNTRKGEVDVLNGRTDPVCMDFSGNLMIVGCDPNQVTLVDLESKQELLSSNFGLGPREIINCVKFINDRSGSMKVALGANKDMLQVFDLEKGTDPVHAFKVPHNVNYMCSDHSGSTVALAYDGKPVDIFDFRSGGLA